MSAGGGPAETSVHQVGRLRLAPSTLPTGGDMDYDSMTPGQRCITSVYVGHDERSGSEPDIRPSCPVASTRAIGSLGSGRPKITV